MTHAENNEEKFEAAQRLFGALSGVEEEYLAACEADGTADGGSAAEEKERGGAPAGMVRFIWKYGKAMAAVLCVAVLGVSYLSFRLGVLSGGMKGFDSGASTEMAMDMDTSMNTSAEAACDEAEAAAGENSADAAPAEAAAEAFDGASVKEKEKVAEESDEVTERKENLKEELEREAGGSGAVSGSSLEIAVCPQDSLAEMTLEQAKALSVVGAYLPAVMPADGRMEQVRGSDAAGEESVVMTWTYGNGWDSFVLSLTNLGSDLPDQIRDAAADLSKPETYDERLYEIPYGDTVPEEYRAVFMDPVFQAKEFDRECVAARILSNVGDSGDTDTPRGNFRVLYQNDEGNYVLVKFSGRGGVDEIWSMMRSIGDTAQ